MKIAINIASQATPTPKAKLKMEQLDEVKQKLTTQYDTIVQAIKIQTPSTNETIADDSINERNNDNVAAASTSHTVTVDKNANANENLGK